MPVSSGLGDRRTWPSDARGTRNPPDATVVLPTRTSSYAAFATCALLVLAGTTMGVWAAINRV